MQLVLSINNGVAIKRFIKILEKSKFNNKTIKYIAPKKVLPVSPIKIFAGFQLNITNTTKEPNNIEISGFI